MNVGSNDVLVGIWEFPPPPPSFPLFQTEQTMVINGFEDSS